MITFTAQATTTETSISTTSETRGKWKALSDSREITSQDIAARCIFVSLLKSDTTEATVARLRKAFTPISNKIKLDNGADPSGALKVALRMVKHSAFVTWLTPDEAKHMTDIAMELSRRTW